jgi:hypothetical protein
MIRHWKFVCIGWVILALAACSSPLETTSGTESVGPRMDDTNVVTLNPSEIKQEALSLYPLNKIIKSMSESERQQLALNGFNLSSSSTRVRVGEPIRARTLVNLNEQVLTSLQSQLEASHHSADFEALGFSSPVEAKSYAARQQLASIRVNLGDIYFVPIFAGDRYIASIQMFASTSRSVGSSTTLLGPVEATSDVFKINQEQATSIGGAKAELVIVPNLNVYWLSGGVLIDTYTGEKVSLEDAQGRTIDLSQGIEPQFDEIALNAGNLPVQVQVSIRGEQ